MYEQFKQAVCFSWTRTYKLIEMRRYEQGGKHTEAMRLVKKLNV